MPVREANPRLRFYLPGTDPTPLSLLPNGWVGHPCSNELVSFSGMSPSMLVK